MWTRVRVWVLAAMALERWGDWGEIFECLAVIVWYRGSGGNLQYRLVSGCSLVGGCGGGRWALI